MLLFLSVCKHVLEYFWSEPAFGVKVLLTSLFVSVFSSGSQICIHNSWPVTITDVFVHNDLKNWKEDTSWHEMHKYIHLPVSFGCSINTEDFFFASYLSSLGCSHVSLLFTSEEQRETGLQHIWYFCNTFMMSLLQTTGHKMAAITVTCFVVVVIFIHWFLTNRTRNRVKNCFVSVFLFIMLFPFLSVGPLMLLSGSPFK